MVEGQRYFLVRKWRFLIGNIDHMRKHLDWLEDQIKHNKDRYFVQFMTIRISRIMLDVLEKAFRSFKEMW